jgi:hypothetical protein
MERPPYIGPVVVYGSTTLIKRAHSGLIPGVWYNEETFKPSVWGPMLGDNYLNKDAKIMLLREVMDNWTYPKQFIRPNSDLKLFSGEVFRNGDFYDWYKRVKSLIDDGTYVNLSLDTEVSVSEAVTIENEYRYFIADKKILSASQYRKNGKLNPYPGVSFPSFFLALDIAKADWQLDDAYVVDIAETNSECKVIEFNNFNSSGFYKCVIKDIIAGASELAEKQYDERMNK